MVQGVYRTSRAGRVARALAAALATIALCAAGMAWAQSAAYDPTAGYGAQGQAGGQYGNQYGSQYGNQYGAQGTGAGSNAPAYSGNQPGGAYSGTAQSNVPTGAFSPTTLGDQTGQMSAGALATPDVQLLNPPDSQTTPGPLYARPGNEPGQFELFSRPPPDLSEFEKFVEESVGRPLQRFGSSLILTRARTFALPTTTTVPPDYALNAGDELLVGVTGSVEANLRLVIDNEGRIFIPKLGAVAVAGVRYGDVGAILSRKLGEQYKKAKVSVVIGRLHGLTIYVTGYAVSPGSYTVSSLSTMVNAVLAAGGPAAGGSFRSVQLRRNGQLISTLDLYELLLNGDRSHDAVLQNGDVLNIAPVGAELAVTGSVNAEAIFEAKAGETLGDMIRYAGGPNSLADDARVILLRLGDLDAEGSRQLPYAAAQAFPAERGDIVRILSLGDILRPQERQAVLATIEGEVEHPGRYYLKPGATTGDLVARAGGLTGGAYPFATELDRDSIRRQQVLTYDRAIDDLELAASVAPLSQRGNSATADNAAADTARLQASLAAIERLRARKPDGRLVLNLSADARAIPASVILETNDRLYIPPRPKTVGVFGAVYRPGSFLFGDAPRLGDYLKLAGGPQHYADRGDIYTVRANGAVLSTRDDHGLLTRPALPGDLIFVPVRTSPNAWQRFLDLTSVIYQFGVGALTIKALGG
jgi:protein involved in polysaccharide export with SLBB domain